MQSRHERYMYTEIRPWPYIVSWTYHLTFARLLSWSSAQGPVQISFVFCFPFLILWSFHEGLTGSTGFWIPFVIQRKILLWDHFVFLKWLWRLWISACRIRFLVCRASGRFIVDTIFITANVASCWRNGHKFICCFIITAANNLHWGKGSPTLSWTQDFELSNTKHCAVKNIVKILTVLTCIFATCVPVWQQRLQNLQKEQFLPLQSNSIVPSPLCRPSKVSFAAWYKLCCVSWTSLKYTIPLA